MRNALDRRRLMQVAAGSAAASALHVAPGQAAAPDQLVPVTLVILLVDRGDGRADAGARRLAMAAFARHALPFGLASASRPGVESSPGAAVEPALWHETAAALGRYFQARVLSDAWPLAQDMATDRQPMIALVTPDPGEALSLWGLSPAGFRCAYLMPDETAPAWIESHPARVVAARGGHVARADAQTPPGSALAAAAAYLDEAAGDPVQTHATLYLDLAGPADAVAALAEGLAADIDARIARGHLVSLAPGEIGVRHAKGFERLIGLRLDPAPGAPADDAATQAMAEALGAAGLAFSVCRDDPATLGPVDCPRLTPEALRATGVPLSLRGRLCAVVSPPDPRAAPILAEAGIAAAMGAGPEGLRGLDGAALLHLGAEHRVTSAEEIDALPARLGLCEDAVLVIETGALALPVRRNAVLAALRRLAMIAGTRIVDLDAFTRAVGARDAMLATLHRTRALAPDIAARAPARFGAADRAAFMADAHRAWAYFEAVTHETTGLPDTTVAFEPDGTPGTRNPMLTQWDTGSAIFGWIAAHRLGLVDAARFEAWVQRLIPALAASTLPAPRLPRAIFYANAPWRGAADFNICDTGRLLTALKALDRMLPEGDARVRDLVAGWNIASMVIDGQPHAWERGAVVAGPDAHCTGYIKRALALWGIAANSQYDVFDRGETEADAAMHLLTEVADIGALGAEPLLLEALEFGFDAPGRVLRDVLLAAQIDAWHQTGTLIAPSEGPIDRPPWFTYQGLRIDREGADRWDVFSSSTGGAPLNEATRNAVRMLSCKAPYLWAAAHPHPYSDRLVTYVRAGGKMLNGFVAGIYSETGTPTLNYGDVNTNGIILEAIAALLGAPIRA